MKKTEQETEFEQIQNGRQQKQTSVLNIENNDDSYSLMFLKGSYCKTMESPLFH
jgi:hypothetical protein